MSGFDNEVVVSLGARLEPSTSQAIMLMQKNATDVSRINHEGDPEGAVSANPSSLCHDPVAGKVYIKDSGTGNTGWRDIAPDNVPVGGLAYFSTGNGDAYIGDKWLKLDGSILLQADYPLLFERLGYVNGPFTNFFTTTTVTGSVLSSVIYDGAKFVAAGSGGVLQTSTNGITWTLGASTTTYGINGISFNGSIYVVAAGPQALSSTNLVAWTTAQSNNVNSSLLAYGNSTYVVTNVNKFQSRSTDGINWTTKTPQGISMVFGNSRLVAAGNLSSIVTATDPDNLWRVVSANIGVAANINDLLYGGGLFVCCGNTSTVASSTDGYTWNATPSGAALAYNVCAFGAGVYVFGATTAGSYRTTSNFVTFTTSQNNTGVSVPNLAYGAGLFVSIVAGNIYTSTDGFTTPWTNAGAYSPGGSPNCLRYVNSLFIAGGAGGLYATSTNGTAWNASSPFGALVMRDVIFDGALYVASFSSGTVGSSTDALTWTTHTTLTNGILECIAFNGTKYYTGSTDNLVQSSTDLITWVRESNIPASLGDNLNSLSFGNGLFLSGTSAGKILSSTDGITWTSHNTLTSSPVGFAGGGGGLFYTGRSNSIATSTDLTTFTAAITGATTQTINFVEYVNGIYVAGGSAGYIRTSTDAHTWDQISTTITNQQTQAAAGSADTIVVVGNTGFLSYSPGTYPYDETTEFQLPTDAVAPITLEYPSNFRRSLYIRAA